jgi:hypothetical protein
MPRPDVDYLEEASAEELIAYIAASRTAIPELCAYTKHLETILRDWLDACPETCGQCEGVHERARWMVVEAGK